VAERKGGNLALIFGGGGDAAPEGGPSGDAEPSELGADEGDMGMEEEADAPPPDFAVHAAEAFPELAGDDARLDALYRTIKACHPGA
jgi:hypothetical protein